MRLKPVKMFKYTRCVCVCLVGEHWIQRITFAAKIKAADAHTSIHT